MTPLQTELNEIEQRAAAESALVIANADKINELYALHEKLQAHGADVSKSVVLHRHTSQVTTTLYVYEPNEASVQRALQDLYIELGAGRAGCSGSQTDYPVIGTSCMLTYLDRPYTQAAA